MHLSFLATGTLKLTSKSSKFCILYTIGLNVTQLCVIIQDGFKNNNHIDRSRFSDYIGRTMTPTTTLCSPCSLCHLSVSLSDFVTLQESIRCCATTETFSMTVRSRDCAACEMNVTVSIGTSATPNFLALKDTHTHIRIIKLNSYYKHLNYTDQYVHLIIITVAVCKWCWVTQTGFLVL